MHRIRPFAAASLAAAVLVGAACSSSSEDATSASTTTAPPPPEDVEVTPPASTSVPVREIADGPLDEHCPPRLIVQTDSLPTVRLGPLYSLVDAPRIDDVGQHVVGDLRRPDGTVENVELELRSGGPSIGFRNTLDVLDSDAGVHLAVTGLTDLVSSPGPAGDARASEPVGVVALAGTNDQMIMWDPATYPDVVDLEGLRAADVPIRHVTGSAAIDFLSATGVVDASDLDEAADPGVAGFITAGGTIARQGDAIIDPLLFPALAQWSRPIAFDPATSHGWGDVERVMATAVDRLDDACLGRLVPVIQAAIAAYDADHAATNQLMADARNRFAPLNRVSATLLDAAAERDGPVGSLVGEFTGTVGGFDLESLAGFLNAWQLTLDRELRDLDSAVTVRYLDPSA